MTDLRKAAEMALEALEWNYGTDLCDIENCIAWLDKMNATIPALRQALAQSEQKREWVGLTDKELSTLSVSAGIISWSKHDYLVDKKQFRELPIDEGMDGDKVCLMQFAQLIEAKLKERNSG